MLDNYNYITIEQAIDKLIVGELVAIPTETVYGLAGNIHNEQAIQSIFKLKTRPYNHPLIVHVHSNFDIEKYAVINHTAQKILRVFWQAPLTMVLPKTKYVPDNVTGGQNTVAIRSPNHALTQALLKEINIGVAAPSANKFGCISPTTAKDVYEEFNLHNPHNIPYFILDGGACEVGIESTIININDDNTVSILRQGIINIEQLSQIVEVKIDDNFKKNIKVSGNLLSHYSPATPCIMLETDELKHLWNVNNKEDMFILCFKDFIQNIDAKYLHITMPNNPYDYAKILYASLRQADNICQAQKIKHIYIEKPPTSLEWLAIYDRLSKASYRKS